MLAAASSFALGERGRQASRPLGSLREAVAELIRQRS
jgi:hypothetical protein